MARVRHWHECDAQAEMGGPDALQESSRTMFANWDHPVRHDGKWLFGFDMMLVSGVDIEGVIAVRFCPWCGVNLEEEFQRGESMDEAKKLLSIAKAHDERKRDRAGDDEG